jgi:hypothetical protein
MNIVEQIHREFYTASDEIVKFSIPEKAKILHSLGFTSSEDAKDFDVEREKLRDLVLHYQCRYLNNKFITDEAVQKICKKYNLICGPVSVYTGKVPDSKLREISRFRLDYTDSRKPEYTYTFKYYKKNSYYSLDWLTLGSKWHKILPESITTTDHFYSTTCADTHLNKVYKTGIRWLVDSMEESQVKFDTLFICAPENEIKTEGLAKKDLFAFLEKKRHIEDPVVLHPCKGGFLIVAAWGPEASDESVVNEKMN